MVQGALEQARVHGVDLRGHSRSLRWPGLEQSDRVHRPVSNHPLAPRRGAGNRTYFQARLRYRLFPGWRCFFSLSLLLAIAIAIKFDSHGSVFYTSERIGKKGVVFRCIKFRTMIRDADIAALRSCT